MRISMETLAGRYVLGDVLGHGGTAIVVRAHDRKLRRTVAIKILAENLAADPAVRRRFLREARMAARWSHPNIVQVFDAGEQDGRPYMVMEYMPGPNLEQDLRTRGALSPEETVRIGVQVCAGLQHAHDAGLVHRDVKPANILHAGDGVVKMTDFGIAFDPTLTGLTEVGTVLGTVAYLAPERVAGEEETPAEDIYSLGVCLYQMLTLRTPYDATALPDLALQQRTGAITPLRELAPDVPEALADTIERCLARSPEDRPASAAHLARELLGERPTRTVTTALEGAGATIATGPAQPNGTRVLRLTDEDTVLLHKEEPQAEPGALPPAPVRRRLTTLVGAGLAALALAAGALFMIDAGTDEPGTQRSPVRSTQNTAPPATQGDPAAPAQEARDLAEWLRSQAGE